MDIKEKVKIVSELQRKSIDVFNSVVSNLEVGLSEVDIAELVKKEFAKNGVKECWYNVPFMVLIGIERFQIGTTTSDYSLKEPSNNTYLKEGEPVHMDFSPMDLETKIWGDWSSTIVFHPRNITDNEQIVFLDEMRKIQRSIVPQITSKTTGADIANFYLNIFNKEGIKLLDVRNNVGHSIHKGAKDEVERVWLDQNNTEPLGEGIFTIEPGGICQKKDGHGVVVGRFEDCIYIPNKGKTVILE